MRKPRRQTSSPTSKKKTGKPVSPEQIRAYTTEMYQLRQAAWQVQLLEDCPDWEHLLSLHLQMSELEHLAAELESLA